jgi:hypothetical protein
MKKILLALTMTGFIYVNAHAQTKPCSIYDQNYKVCDNSKGYTICGNLPSSCNTQEPGKANNKVVNTAKTSRSVYDINYPVCKNKDGYTICTDEELQKQMTNPEPVTNPASDPGQHAICNVIHNGILVSYYDKTSCNNAELECGK